MKLRTVGLGLVASGVIGLGLLTVPLGATAAPSLPPVEPEALIASVLAPHTDAFAGTVELDNQLGLPAVPGIPQAANGKSAAQVATDGQNRGRVSLPSGAAERLVVADGTTVWAWDSAKRTVTKAPADSKGIPGATEPLANPADAAKKLLDVARPFSTVSVDGTSEVAGRPAYELVLAPLPSERTLLREVRLAVDSEKRIPLRLTVLAHGSPNPVLKIGFTELNFGPQDPGLFQFTPPEGATVRERSAPDMPDRGQLPAPTVVGEGWDTVLLTKLPTEAGGGPSAAQLGGFVSALGKPVSGPWGNGRLITTTVASAILTDDGRVAVGAVPEQVLSEALSR